MKTFPGKRCFTGYANSHAFSVHGYSYNVSHDTLVNLIHNDILQYPIIMPTIFVNMMEISIQNLKQLRKTNVKYKQIISTVKCLLSL